MGSGDTNTSDISFSQLMVLCIQEIFMVLFIVNQKETTLWKIVCHEMEILHLHQWRFIQKLLSSKKIHALDSSNHTWTSSANSWYLCPCSWRVKQLHITALSMQFCQLCRSVILVAQKAGEKKCVFYLLPLLSCLPHWHCDCQRDIRYGLTTGAAL